MRVAIRVDATAQIGTGHLMRTLTVADRLALAGACVRFLCRALPAHLQALVRLRHELVELPAGGVSPGMGDLPHSHWLGASQPEDAAQTLASLAGESWHWMIVDHYALDARWERALRVGGPRRVLVIDDLADRHHECDLLLDQNLYPGAEQRYAGLVPTSCRQLLGPQYALLREEFMAERSRIRARTGPMQRLMIFLGGMDAGNRTSRALAGVALAGLGPLSGDVVIGAQHPAQEAIEWQCEQAGFTCHRQTARMAEMMAAADLAIGATGSASWERCCLGLPTVGVAIAANQEPIAAGLEAAGAILRVEEAPGRMEQGIAAALRLLANDAGRRHTMSSEAAKLVDGQGSRRVVEAMTLLP
jgi:UDP-2,4-diacetamido-2,4,6-trideoxy-beta-L-altropyranose hydrolase